MTSWTKEEWEAYKKECQEETGRCLKKTINDCFECPYCLDCFELGWENVEEHRQPNGRFGKLYRELRKE